MKNRSTFSLIFWVCSSRIKNNQVPVYARITVNGKRANISIQRRVNSTDWDAARGIMRGTRQESKLLNKYLDQVRSKIYTAYEDLLSENKMVTAQAIKNRYLGADKFYRSLQELFEYHNEISRHSISAHTLRHYKVTQGYLQKFLRAKFNLEDFRLIYLNFSFIKDFEFFIKSYQPTDHQRKMGHNTAMKHLQRLRKMVTMAYHHEWIPKDPFVRFKSSYVKKRREFLTREDFQSIEDFQSSINRLNIVKDIFLFSCYTGLSYIDITKLTMDNIGMDFDGNQWIETERQKTKTALKIPLLNQARDILKRYQDHPKTVHSKTLLPRYSNQKLNSYLKEIADFCGIKKHLTFHIARHTFATTITLTNGVPIETVSKLLGHTKLATTQIYARVVDKKVKDDMAMLNAKLNHSSD